MLNHTWSFRQHQRQGMRVGNAVHRTLTAPGNYRCLSPPETHLPQAIIRRWQPRLLSHCTWASASNGVISTGNGPRASQAGDDFGLVDNYDELLSLDFNDLFSQQSPPQSFDHIEIRIDLICSIHCQVQ